jgi:hypothetical protein
MSDIRKPFIPQPPVELERGRSIGEHHIDLAIGCEAGELSAELWAEARVRICDVLEDVRERSEDGCVGCNVPGTPRNV